MFEKESYILNVKVDESLPILEDSEFLYPRLNFIVHENIDSNFLKMYFVEARGYKKVYTALKEMEKKNLVQYCLGLQEGMAIKNMGLEFFEKHFEGDVFLYRGAVRKEEKILVPFLYSSKRRCRCKGEDTAEEVLVGWADANERRYIWNDFHPVYNKEGKYRITHDILQ